MEKRNFTTDFIVLKRKQFGEYDRIVTILTQQRGKISTIAKGVRKPHSRRSSSLEPFSHSQGTFVQGRSFPILTDSKIIEYFPNLRINYEMITTVMYIMELCDALTREDNSICGIFELVLSTLRRLNSIIQSSEVFPLYHLVIYELRLLRLCGFYPDCSFCSECNTTFTDTTENCFLGTHGVFCAHCQHLALKDQEGRALKIPRRLLDALLNDSNPHHFTVPSPELKNAHYFTQRVINNIIGRNLVTMRFLC